MSLMTLGVGPGGFGVAAGGGDGTLAVVQHDTHTESNGFDDVQTITSATAGNLLVCMTCTGSATVAHGTSPTDNIGGAWTTQLSQNTAGADVNSYYYRFRIFTKVAEGGETTITYTGSFEGQTFYTIWEISKTSGTFNVDGTTDIGTGTGATSWGPETGITLAGDKSMILMMGVSTVNPSMAAPYNTNELSFDQTPPCGTSSYANSLTGSQTLSSVFSSASTGWIAGAIGIRAS